LSQALQKASSGLAETSGMNSAQTSAKMIAKTSEGKAAEVERLIAPAVEAMGYDIVRVQLSGGDRLRLQIMAERLADGRMNVDDCAEVSRAVAAILDVEDPIDSAYALEVSSPGIDRPLTRLGDFDRFAGFEARIETALPIEGRRRFRGRLLGTRGTDIAMVCEEQEITLPFADVQKAKLVLTDELIAASQQAGGSADGSSDGSASDQQD
jgi:ribosome maturation factor RimP